MEKSPDAMLLQGIPAGFLIAGMVWMIPSAEGADFWVILLTTYLIALCDLTHVVAGSAEAFLLLVAGDIGLGRALGGFLLPVLIGNIIGGTALFTLLAYGQVKDEL
jgi:formate/nitrite transporter FocA (FNT family)